MRVDSRDQRTEEVKQPNRRSAASLSEDQLEASRDQLMAFVSQLQCKGLVTRLVRKLFLLLQLIQKLSRKSVLSRGRLKAPTKSYRVYRN